MTSHYRLLLLLALLALACDAFQHGLASRLATRVPTARRRRSALEDLVAGRKGRPRMPRGMGQGMPQPGQMPPEIPSDDGTPLFYLFCRTANVPTLWYPVSSMKGDGQSKGLINAWLNSPFGKMAFKNRLDSGMARSIFDSERQLADAAVRTHPALKKMQNSLEWGYKVVDREIMAKEQAGEIEKQKVIHVTRSMIDDGFINQAGKKWDEILEGATKKAEELF